MNNAVYYNDIDPFCCNVLRKQVRAGNLPEGDIDERDITTVRASELMGYRHVHLFAGIGGFALGFLWAGMPLSLRVLTGGFPCQDISSAGQMAGIHGERSGLWKQMYRIIRRSRKLGRPFDYIVIENVRNLLSGGDYEKEAPQEQETQTIGTGMLCAENQRPMDDAPDADVFKAWMGVVLGDLADAGYDAQWRVLRASDFGAPHLRARVLIVAYHPLLGSQPRWASSAEWGASNTDGSGPACLAHTTGQRQQERANPTRVYTEFDAPDPGYVANASCSQWGSHPEKGGNVVDGANAGWEKAAGGSAICREELAHPNSHGRGWQERTVSRNMASSTGANAARQKDPQRDAPQCRSADCPSDQPGGGTVKSVLGGNADGLSSWLDGHQWPAGPGYAQDPCEPARMVAEKIPDRAVRLKALGNALLPQKAAYIAWRIQVAIKTKSEVQL